MDGAFRLAVESAIQSTPNPRVTPCAGGGDRATRAILLSANVQRRVLQLRFVVVVAALLFY